MCAGPVHGAPVARDDEETEVPPEVRCGLRVVRGGKAQPAVDWVRLVPVDVDLVRVRDRVRVRVGVRVSRP